MSYIRTKDGIYEVIKNDFGVCIKIDCMFILLDDIKDKIIKEADTIWELCDGFYIDDGSGDFKKENIFETILEFENLYHKKRISDTYAIGYGFIKTDKGLIFVSKLKERIWC